MTVTFGFQSNTLIRDPEYKSFAPTYEYVARFDVDYLHSMVAIKLRGEDEKKGKSMSQKSLMKDLRVSFKLSNGTYLDAIYCSDLYADLIEQAS